MESRFEKRGKNKMTYRVIFSFMKRHWRFFVVFCIIAVLTIFLFYVHPSAIVLAIGVKNIYAATFLLAIIGGVSAFTATSFYATLFAFALGGANPFLLALFSAPGVLMGDLIFWYLGYKGKAVVKPAIGRIMEKLSSWLLTKPRWFIPVGAYVYTGFLPLPGEFLMVVLALLGISFTRVWLPTLLGNYTLALIVSSSAVYGLAFANFIL